ncbi:hypothetical protein C2E23DRAFT_858050 [Lenzites betulinus]|nr:hypothetical protein C2E23DRAFT_858050 [Lenzites betulinus]
MNAFFTIEPVSPSDAQPVEYILVESDHYPATPSYQYLPPVPFHTLYLLGWGSLIVAAGASYYYARKSINERRVMQEARGQRPSEKLDWRSRIEQDEKPKAGLGPAAAAPSPAADAPSSVSATATAVDPRGSGNPAPS